MSEEKSKELDAHERFWKEQSEKFERNMEIDELRAEDLRDTRRHRGVIETHNSLIREMYESIRDSEARKAVALERIATVFERLLVETEKR